MNPTSVEAALAASSYPGRGIIAGLSESGRHAVVAYFIMGRSVNSRNRVFVKEGDGLRTQAFDPAKMTDPSLIIYRPLRVLGKQTIATNGDQTDTIYDALQNGGSFESALKTRRFEPDKPNYTPRISALITLSDGGARLNLSVLKCADGKGEASLRCFYEYDAPEAGAGYFIHTYRGDGDPLPSFAGEPETLRLSGGIDQLTQRVWGALNEDNRVSLLVRFIDIASGAFEDRIVNRNR